MNAVVQIVEYLQAIDAEILDLVSRPMKIDAREKRLAQARTEQLLKMEGRDGVQRLHKLATKSLYAEQLDGRSLD